MGRIDSGASAWALVDANRYQSAKKAMESRAHEGDSRHGDSNVVALMGAMKSVSLIAFSATAKGDAIKLGVEGLVEDEETRELMEDAMRGIMAAWRLAANEKSPELVQVLRKFKIEHARGVSIRGTPSAAVRHGRRSTKRVEMSAVPIEQRGLGVIGPRSVGVTIRFSRRLSGSTGDTMKRSQVLAIALLVATAPAIARPPKPQPTHTSDPKTVEQQGTSSTTTGGGSTTGKRGASQSSYTTTKAPGGASGSGSGSVSGTRGGSASGEGSGSYNTKTGEGTAQGSASGTTAKGGSGSVSGQGSVDTQSGSGSGSVSGTATTASGETKSGTVEAEGTKGEGATVSTTSGQGETKTRAVPPAGSRKRN
jgi:hypothetical protein